VTSDDRLALRQQLILHEGWRLKPYVDTVGKITIGVGRNLTDRGISATECDLLLSRDMDMVLHELAAQCPWFDELDGIRQRVVADMCFNLGIAKLLQFHETIHAIQRDDFAGAARQMLASKWAKQVGSRAQRLALMMDSGCDYDD